MIFCLINDVLRFYEMVDYHFLIYTIFCMDLSELFQFDYDNMLDAELFRYADDTPLCRKVRLWYKNRQTTSVVSIILESPVAVETFKFKQIIFISLSAITEFSAVLLQRLS